MFSCQNCELTFKFKKSFVRHTLTKHSDTAKTFGCVFCPSGFKRKDGLKRHCNAVHEGKVSTLVYPCQECHKEFSSKGNLSVHAKTVHGGVHYQCIKCEKIYSS